MIIDFLERYGVPWTSIENGDGELSVHGPLPSGDKYSLFIDTAGDGRWEMFDGHRRHSGETDPRRVVESALSELLCLHGLPEKHPTR